MMLYPHLILLSLFKSCQRETNLIDLFAGEASTTHQYNSAVQFHSPLRDRKTSASLDMEDSCSVSVEKAENQASSLGPVPVGLTLGGVLARYERSSVIITH